MTSTNKRLSRIGLTCSGVYLIVLAIGLSFGAHEGWITFEPIRLNELGDLLAGLFGPLAIFWLILGFFQQGEELGNSVAALNLQAEELKHSVEQQKALVGITKKQLELDVDVREEQNRLALAKELPLFQIRPGGSSSHGGQSGFIQYNFVAKNMGAAAESVELSINDTELLLNNGHQDYTDGGGEFNFSIVAPPTLEFEKHENGALLEVVSVNPRQQMRIQRFLIGNFRPKMMTCEPPQQ